MSINKMISPYGYRRNIAWLLIMVLVFASNSLQLAVASAPEKNGVQSTSKIIHSTALKSSVAKRRPSPAELTKPVHRKLILSQNPSDLEIFNARIFATALVPMDSKGSPHENSALAASLVAFKSKNNPEDISDLTKFLDTYPKSRWQAAVEENLGQVRFETGYLTDALKYWARAWKNSKEQTLPERKAIADQAISNLVLLEAQLGLMDSLDKHLSEIRKRTLTGTVEQKVKLARNGLWSMQHSPETSFKCGPFAVNTLLYLNSKTIGCSGTIRKAPSTTKGTNLAQVEDWSKEIGLKLQMAQRSSGAKIIVPAVMHWKVGHFCAITAQGQGRYRIQDPTFGNQGNLWLTAKAIDNQTDGYFLVPNGQLPTGWRKITRKKAENVWGKGVASGPDGSKTPSYPKTCTVSCGCGSGMAVASVFSMNATLNIVDTPLGYNPPIGPSMNIGINYNYNEGNQPGTFTFTNLGQDWSINWLSYLTIDGSSNITVRTRGGGYELYDYSGSYSPNLTSQARIVNLGGGSYQRLLPDGSVENFTLSDGTNTYMTSVTDPQGNAATISYDAYYRVTSITDASSNPATTFTYVSNTFGNAGFYKIASITDGFGRSASFAYDSTTTFLTSITDAVGSVSQFVYDPSSSFINMMITPYGSTSFYQYTPAAGNVSYPPTGLRFTFPDSSTAVIENWLGEQKQTYYWDREATALYPSDPAAHNYSHCTSTRWLWEQATNLQSPVINWTRPALEAPVVYTYPGETYQDFCGTSNKPTQIDKQLTGFRNTATITGTITSGDKLGINVSDLLLPWTASYSGNVAVYYIVQPGDTLSSIASGLAAAINSNNLLQAFGVSATSASNAVIMTSQSINATSYSNVSSGSPTETITFANGPNPAENATFGGTVSSSDVLTITVHDSGLGGGQESVNYTVQSTDTLITITQALATAISADTNLQALGVSAVWTGVPSGSPYLSIQSNSPNSTTYTSSESGGATETISLAASTSGIQQTTAYDRNTLGYITQSIDQCGRELQYTYAANNIDLLSIDSPASPNNFMIGQWQYTDVYAPHRPTLYTDGSGQQTQYTYNGFSELATITDPNSNTTTLSYDGSGYLTQIQGPLSGSDDITTFTFYGYGPVETITNSEGYELTYSYDNLNRLTNTAYPDGTAEQIIYDRLDAVLRSDRLGRWTQDAYDCLDQLSYETDPLGRKTNYCWCACGSLMALTDPSHHTTTWQHDLEGRVIEKIYTDSTAINYTYEPSGGRLLTKTDALSQTTNYLYNLDNTLQHITYSNAVNATSPVTTAYDTVFPRTINITNDWGQYTYTYNPYYTTGSAITGGGRLTSVTNNVISNSAITYTYDALGRTTNRSINASSNSTTCTYDAINRITQEVNPLGTFGYNYINNVSGSSKGDLRLSSINYPNSQTTNFSYLPNIGDERLQQIANLNPSSATLSQFNYAYDSAAEITQWQQQQNSGNAHFDLGYDTASQLTSALSDSGSAFNAYISGTPHTGDVVSITAYDASLTSTIPVGQETASYTVMGGDTSANIATNLASNIGTAMSNISVTASATGSVISISTSPNYCTQFTCAVTGGGATDTISLSSSSAIQSLHKQLYYNYDCAGNRIGVQADSTGSFPTGLTTTATKYTYNNVNELTATSAGGPIRFQGTTVNPIKSAVVNITQTATIGGTITAGDVLTISVHDKGLSQGENVNYTVLIGDSTTSIATALKNAINADSTLTALGVTATSSGAVITISSSSVNSTKYTQTISAGATETITLGGNCSSTATISPSTAFTANPQLASGTNTADVTAVSGGGTPATNTYPITINAATSQSLTYDSNGNMTSDGTNSYAWDVENRLIKITYPGVNNYSSFTYDPLGRCTKIVETVSGSITSTKQFVWCGNQMCEARDASSTITAQYFLQGETISSSNYYYSKDHLGSIREITNSSGTIQAQYAYDPYGQVTKIAGSGPDSDFQYAGYYYHGPSGLNLTLNRAYNPGLGRWINRDPIGETLGANLYSYVNNETISVIDPSGLAAVVICLPPWWWQALSPLLPKGFQPTPPPELPGGFQPTPPPPPPGGFQPTPPPLLPGGFQPTPAPPLPKGFQPAPPPPGPLMSNPDLPPGSPGGPYGPPSPKPLPGPIIPGGLPSDETREGNRTYGGGNKPPYEELIPPGWWERINKPYINN